MENQPEVIRNEMCATRSDLATKLEALEQHVMGNVHSVTTSVNETVANVKGAVNETITNVSGAVNSTVCNVSGAVNETVCNVRQTVGVTATTFRETVGDTVETVKDSLDVERQVIRHPWLMVGGALALGFLGGKLVSRLSQPLAPAPAPLPPPTPLPSAAATAMPTHLARDEWGPTPAAAAARPEERAAGTPPPPPPQQPQQEGLVASYLHMFEPEVQKLKGLAIGALFGAVKDMLRSHVPDTLQPQLTEVVDDVTTKLGGRPLRGHVLDELQATFSR